jgi:hypothetical protein
MLYLATGNMQGANRYLESNKEPSPLNAVIDVIIADRTKSPDKEKYIATLMKMLPDDIITNIILLNIKEKDRNLKDFMFKVQEFVRTTKLNLDAVSYGPLFAGELYVKLGLITGQLPKIEAELEARLKEEKYDRLNLVSRLAYVKLYLKKFYEAHQLYSYLVDNLKLNDTKTLFMASLASLSINKNAEAISFLELSKIIDPNNKESRVGIGLLKHEGGNIRDATFQYNTLGDGEFKSEYFDFELAK